MNLPTPFDPDALLDARRPSHTSRHRPGVRRAFAVMLAIGLTLARMSSFAGQSVATGATGAPETLAIAGAQTAANVPVAGRDDEGRLTLRALRLDQPLAIDGRLDDAVYEGTPATAGFVQQEPRPGDSATEATDIWILYDATTLYVAARLWDSEPDRIIATEMRRDHRNIGGGDSVTVALDTFLDRRNGVLFQTNLLGALRDAQVTDERNENTDWNTVWTTRSARFDGGWSVEMAIPFRSLRYGSSGPQVWGINVERNVRWKNERSFLSPIPPAFSFGGINRFSLAATLTGVETPAGAKNLEVKPFAIATSTTDRRASPPTANELSAAAGVDVKYGLTRGLTADLTINTDFAQVEADQDQVNLTRFSLFFPEKREFFLEGQGVFAFGGGQSNPFGPGGDTPVMFYSRRIGIDGGVVAPIRAGGRVTGRAGPYTLGLLDIQAGAAGDISPTANFSVVRVRRDTLKRSTVGIIGTHRSALADGSGTNQVFGIDTNLAFFTNLTANAYWAESRTPGSTGDQSSYRVRVGNQGDRYGFEYEHLLVGADFNPEVGFVRRSDFRLNRLALDFTPRVAGSALVRKFQYGVSLDRYATGAGVLATREVEGSVGVQFQSGDEWNVEYTRSYEAIDRPFRIAAGVSVPAGAYDFQRVSTFIRLGQQRPLSGFVQASRGSFWNGTRTEASYNGRIDVSTRLSFEPRVQMDWVDLPTGAFRSRLLGSRVTYTHTPRMSASALVQFNSSTHTVSTNVRLRWEYEPGSDLYVVYSEGRDTESSLGEARAPSGLQNRGVAIKFTKLWRF